MNPREILNIVPNVVADREASPTDRWILMIIDEKIQCIPADGEQVEGLPLMPITMKHINAGLSGREWDRITNRIDEYQKDHPDFYANEATVETTIKDETEPEEKKDIHEAKTTPDAE